MAPYVPAGLITQYKRQQLQVVNSAKIFSFSLELRIIPRPIDRIINNKYCKNLSFILTNNNKFKPNCQCKFFHCLFFKNLELDPKSKIFM